MQSLNIQHVPRWVSFLTWMNFQSFLALGNPWQKGSLQDQAPGLGRLTLATLPEPKVGFVRQALWGDDPMSHSTQSGDAECLAKCRLDVEKPRPVIHGIKSWNLSDSNNLLQIFANRVWKLFVLKLRSIVHHRCGFAEDPKLLNVLWMFLLSAPGLVLRRISMAFLYFQLGKSDGSAWGLEDQFSCFFPMTWGLATHGILAKLRALQTQQTQTWVGSKFAWHTLTDDLVYIYMCVYIYIEMYIYIYDMYIPPQNWPVNGNPIIWRCISYWKWAFSNVMLCFQGCICITVYLYIITLELALENAGAFFHRPPFSNIFSFEALSSGDVWKQALAFFRRSTLKDGWKTIKMFPPEAILVSKLPTCKNVWKAHFCCCFGWLFVSSYPLLLEGAKVLVIQRCGT